MKILLKVSAIVALAASAPFASADSLNLASYGSTTGFSQSGVNTGSLNNTAMQFNPTSQPISGSSLPQLPTTTTAFELNPGGVWESPEAGSAWVGVATSAGPVGTSNPAFGYYTFQTSFNAAGGSNYAGSLKVDADDTTSVWLDYGTANQQQLVMMGSLGSDGHCSDNPPSCLVTDTISLVNLTLLAGSNTLTFVVEQMGTGPTGGSGDPSGVDFVANLQSPTATTPTPEPNPLILLGTGLLGSAGLLLRRKRS
jgi:hypothetical protein